MIKIWRKSVRESVTLKAIFVFVANVIADSLVYSLSLPRRFRIAWVAFRYEHIIAPHNVFQDANFLSSTIGHIYFMQMPDKIPPSKLYVYDWGSQLMERLYARKEIVDMLALVGPMAVKKFEIYETVRDRKIGR